MATVPRTAVDATVPCHLPKWFDAAGTCEHPDHDADHTFTVTVSGCTEDEARQVMAERIGYDEDYGFSYKIDWS